MDLQKLGVVIGNTIDSEKTGKTTGLFYYPLNEAIDFSIENIEKNILPKIIEYVQTNSIDTVEFFSRIGNTKVNMTATKDTTLVDLTLEFKKFIKDDKFKFNSLIERIKKVEPINIYSEDLTMSQAMKWSKEVLTLLFEIENIETKAVDIKILSEALKGIGAISLDELKVAIASNNKFIDISSSKGEANNLATPLTVVAQCIDSDNIVGLQRALEGGMQYSWVGAWIREQENFEKKNGNVENE